jgi:hypothetical protein
MAVTAATTSKKAPMSKQRLDDLLAEIADEAEAGEADQTERPIPEHVKVTRGNPRSKVLQVRLNPDEMAALEAIADRRELPVSTVAREQLLRLIAADPAADTGRAYAASFGGDDNGGDEPGEPNALAALVALLNGIGQLDELAEEVRRRISDAQLPMGPAADARPGPTTSYTVSGEVGPVFVRYGAPKVRSDTTPPRG